MTKKYTDKNYTDKLNSQCPEIRLLLPTIDKYRAGQVTVTKITLQCVEGAPDAFNILTLTKYTDQVFYAKSGRD